MGLSRGTAVTVASTGVVVAGAGVLWWRAGSGGEAPGMAQYAAVSIGASLFGGFVLWHRPGNRYGRVHLAVGVLFASVVLAAGALSGSAGLPTWAGQVALAWSWLALPLLLPLWVMVIAAFPDGRFHRRFLGPLTVAVACVMALLTTAAYLLFPGGEPLPLIGVRPPAALTGPLAGLSDSAYRALSVAGAALGSGVPVLALVALVDRYRRSGLVVRQQIKWLLAGVTVSVLLQAIPVAAIEHAPLRTAASTLVVLAVPLPLAAAAVAILKHGLWEIDVVISHGLVYAVLSGVLTAVFLAASFAAGVTVGGADGRVVAAIALALLISYLAHPVRGRLVSMVGRALFGEGPRGVLALTSETGWQTTGDASSEGTRIAAATRSALGAPWAQVWLFLPRDGGAGGILRPLAGRDRQVRASVVASEASTATLVGVHGAQRVSDLPGQAADVVQPMVGGPADMVAPLLADGSLLGVLTCGARPGDPYGDDELALLGVLARDASLALRNLHLEEELRRRLEDIEAQADELRRSRQRLISAQDEERRRIERDLHDGAQQQLVLLAVALRRAAQAHGSRDLVGLADRAEEAVFSLQELARGIYPSVLVDQGLQAALETQVARLPVAVRLEVDPGLHGRRLRQDLEAVLYYVALEATTNAVKHAPGAQITVSLRANENGRVAVLEVHDDGPGFSSPSPRTSGLQNMADRVAAAGGTFAVDSAPGAGTWVRVELPVPATVTALRDRAGSP